MLTLKEKSLDWALAHVERYGDTDVFPTPFEYAAIRHDWDTVRSFLHQQDVLEWTVRPHRFMLAPKARYGFRVITQLDPLDSLLFLATVRELCSTIEQRRISKDEGVVHSYRTAPAKNGRLFDPRIGYRTFLNASRQVLADDPRVSYVVVTDISDFYSRIYHHRLENALHASTNKSNHIGAIMNLLSGWNSTETFGIPVGNSASRLLAELTLADVDEGLLAEGVKFVRFNDDYRIFVRNQSEGYRALAFLADTLYRNHGLTLQQQKTRIVSRNDFSQKFLSSMMDRELESLREKFDQLIDELELEHSYKTIEYDDLNEEQQELVDSLNLQELMREQLEEDEQDLALVRFLLRRLAQLQDGTLLREVLDCIDALHPVFPDIVQFIERLVRSEPSMRPKIAGRILDIYTTSIVSELPYHRLWCLHLFAEMGGWEVGERFPGLYGQAGDDVSKRQLILAMGRAERRHWFQSNLRTLSAFAPWPRRAVLAAASCMPPDARKHWYRAVEPQLDPLERAVTKWARQHPFGDT